MASVGWRELAVLLVCVGLLSSKAPAKKMDISEVRAAVETWVRYVTADAREDAVIESIEPYQVDGQDAAYVVQFKGGGYCLCGADDIVMPVYFYSPHGIYDPGNSDLQYLLWEISERTRFFTKALEDNDPELVPYKEELLDRARYWNDLANGIVTTASPIKTAVTAPTQMTLDGLSCTWSQGSPYNDACPNLTPGNDERCLVGCVGTTMAQIMYYWKWPNSGQGAGSATYYFDYTTSWQSTSLATDPQIPATSTWTNRLRWTSSGGGTLQMNGYWDASVLIQAQAISGSPSYAAALAILWLTLTHTSTTVSETFGEADYDWSIMADSHSDPPGTGAAEAAEISYHAGVAVDMDYGLFSSGAVRDSIAPAFSDHFRYDPDAVLQTRNSNTMITEIQWLRPVALGGNDANGAGHQWVIYGYNSTNSQFLMNMGWGGNNNGWYTVSNIPQGFNLTQENTIYIAPEGNVRFVGSASSGNGSPANPCADIEDALVIVPNGGTLIFKAGTTNTFSSSSLTISGINLTLKGEDVIIQRSY